MTSLTTFTSIGEDDEEGVCAFLTPTGWMPMVSADAERVDELMIQARVIAEMTQRPVFVRRWTVPVNVTVIVPHEDV
jgi:pyruvate/2-oxoacid:ferredoxin oxidoreductase alpha subunit